jgi:hypothetical protein
VITESVSVRIDIRAETAEGAERGNGTEIEGLDATREETTTTDHQEEIEICLMIAEAVGEDDVVIEVIATVDLEEGRDGSERRAQLLRLRRRNLHQISQMSCQFWSARDD